MLKLVRIIAVSFFFSAWGDRLWNFAVALYLIKITPGSLQLAAIYGLVQMVSAILFSPIVGDWIDRQNRLVGVRMLLVLSNLFVLLCAVCIIVYLRLLIEGESWLKAMQAVIILLGSIAYLTGTGEKICVSKDWIVVICKQDTDLLASANTLLRRIDLTVAILAPVGVGLLMTVISDLAGIVFICIWNVVTVFGEYLLLLYVYKKEADLHQRVDALTQDTTEDPAQNNVDPSTEETSSHTSRRRKSKNVLVILLSGWNIYRRQTVALAGVALSVLYLTVLGFNSITTSYAYSQGLEEVYISIAYGFGSLFGILGTFLFTFLRNKVGLNRTGNIGGLLQLLMLSLCIISIWLPGSPSSLNNEDTRANADNYTGSSEQQEKVISGITSATFLGSKVFSRQIGTVTKDITKYISVVVMLAGIVLSRSGLWIADLTITQLQQENILESERGVVGGVQNALNSIFELLHFVVTICVPKPRHFWILIFMSVGAVVVSAVIYLTFSVRFSKISPASHSNASPDLDIGNVCVSSNNGGEGTDNVAVVVADVTN